MTIHRARPHLDAAIAELVRMVQMQRVHFLRGVN